MPENPDQPPKAIPEFPAVPAQPPAPAPAPRPAAAQPPPQPAAAQPAPAPVDPRLMRPADRAAAQAQAEAQARKEAPKPALPRPSVGELLELSLTALVNAPGVFAGLEARPVPGPGTSFLAALAWGLVFFALNVSHKLIESPTALAAYPQWQLGAAAACGVAAWAALYLLGSAVLYGLGRALGSGDFDRALLVAAAALAAAPAQALCGWYPAAWPLPSIVAAWIAACGLHALFKANAWAARGVGAALAGGMLAALYGAGELAARYAASAELAAGAAQAAPQLIELQKQMEKQMAQFNEAAAEGAPSGTEAALPGRPGQSSLDLLRGPSGERLQQDAAAPPPQQQRIERMAASADAMSRSALGMLDSITPMLKSPAFTANMTARQKADVAELNREIADLKSGLSGKGTPKENQARMQRVQRLVMRLMGAGAAMPIPFAAPPTQAPSAAAESAQGSQ